MCERVNFGIKEEVPWYWTENPVLENFQTIAGRAIRTAATSRHQTWMRVSQGVAIV